MELPSPAAKLDLLHYNSLSLILNILATCSQSVIVLSRFCYMIQAWLLFHNALKIMYFH